MSNFNHHMSYSELSQALFFVRQQQRLLSKSELGCLELSLQDPLLQKMLELYPLPKQSQKVVTDSLEQQRAQAAAAQVDTNVHNAIYGGVRERTANYLHQNYPTTGHENVIDKVEAFLRKILEKEKARAGLRISEDERYALRQRDYTAGYLGVLTPQQSLEQIAADFSAYVRHLREIYQGGSYAIGSLGAIFQRLESLAGNPGKRDEAELLLLRALDDSRTAYHDKPYSYVPGKGYTCQRGLEERLLDHHALIVPVQRTIGGVSPLERVILTLTEPFILRNAEQGRPSCSQAFYQLYLNAAGYRVEDRGEAYFELSPAADKDSLKEQYLVTISENPLERVRAEHEFDAFMRFLEDTPCHELERNYGPLVVFFSQQEGLLGRVQKMRQHLTAPQALPEHETVIVRMLAHGPFIDRAHLEMVLALHDEKASLASMEQAALSGTPGIEAAFQQSAQEMRQAYQEYLATQEAPFYHFKNEKGLLARFGRSDFHTIGCSQIVLCQWLRETRSQFSAATAQRLAVLCAQGGYAFAIKLLCEREDVGADYVDEQERESLLLMAAGNDHIEAVKALLAAGADVNLLQFRYGETALMVAATSGYTDIVRALLAERADFNLQRKDGATPLMSAAYHGHADTVRALIEAGADMNMQDGNGRTALFEAIGHGQTNIVRALIEAGAEQILGGRTALSSAAYYGHTDIVRALIAAGADVNLQDDNGETALSWAAYYGHTDIVRTLISAGADVNLRNQSGWTVLMHAVYNGRTETVRALLAAGAFDYRFLLIRPLFFLKMVISKLISLFKHTLQLLGLRHHGRPIKKLQNFE